MSGVLNWGWDKDNEVWVPIKVSPAGSLYIIETVDKLDDIGDVSVPSPTDGYVIYWDNAAKLWKCKAPTFLALADTPASFSGQAGKHLRVNAAGNALEFVAAQWTPRVYTTQLDWMSLDGMTTSIPGGGSVNVGGTAIVIASGAVLNNNCLARTTYGFNYPFPSGKEVTVEFPLSHRLSAGGTTHRIVMFLIDHSALPPTETKDHVGFIIDADSIYSSSADGTTQETQDTGVDLPAGVSNFLYQCKAVVDPGVSVKFYVNDVLKTTHTTNPPTAGILGGAMLTFGVKATAAVNQQVGWERPIYTKEL